MRVSTCTPLAVPGMLELTAGHDGIEPSLMMPAPVIAPAVESTKYAHGTLGCTPNALAVAYCAIDAEMLPTCPGAVVYSSVRAPARAAASAAFWPVRR